MKNKALQIQDFQGCFVPVITPMTKAEEIDYPKLESIIEDLIAAGVDGIVPCATTGQSTTLSHDEHAALAERVCSLVHGRTKLIVYAGSNSTREAIALSRSVEERIGPSTLLHVTGYYNCPPQTGLIKHFTAVTDALRHAESNIVMYNVPSRTTSNMTAETAIELAKNPRIIGTKEASGNIEQIKTIIQNTDAASFRVVSGEDKQTVEITELGGFGVISASANAAPSFFTRMTRAALEAKSHGDFAEAYAMQNHINPLIDAVFCAKNPIPLAHMFGTYLRLPLCRVEEIEPRIKEVLKQYSAAELGIDFSNYRTL